MNTHLLDCRIIFLDKEIDVTVASFVIECLLYMDACNPNEKIDIYINSPGGSIADGFAIIDTIKSIKSPVRTICIGKAYSMASLILASGDKGLRYITQHGEVMIHQASTQISGNKDSILFFTKKMETLEQEIVRLLSQWTGQSSEVIRNDMRSDYFLNPEEALKYGIIDKILDYKKDNEIL